MAPVLVTHRRGTAKMGRDEALAPLFELPAKINVV
jgi:hypothetical protein